MARRVPGEPHRLPMTYVQSPWLAAHLGIARATLYRKVKELGITQAGGATPA